MVQSDTFQVQDRNNPCIYCTACSSVRHGSTFPMEQLNTDEIAETRAMTIQKIVLMYCKSVPSQMYTMNIVFDCYSSKDLWLNYSMKVNFSVLKNDQFQSRYQTIRSEGGSYHRFYTMYLILTHFFQVNAKQTQIFIRPCVLCVQGVVTHFIW